MLHDVGPIKAGHNTSRGVVARRYHLYIESVTVNLFIINLLPCLQKAMDVIGISDDDQTSVLQIVAGVLHLGNISFTEQGNYAVPSDDECMYFSSFCICKIQQVLFSFFLAVALMLPISSYIADCKEGQIQLVIRATCSSHVLSPKVFLTSLKKILISRIEYNSSEI